MGMEIEKKFIPTDLPKDLDSYEHHVIEQAYLNTAPVVRIRKQDDDYVLTYKGSGMMAREEYNLPLNKKSYEHLLEKADGNIISKVRYLIPMLLVEVEFSSVEQADAFQKPDWFGEDVTYSKIYHNSYLSQIKG